MNKATAIVNANMFDGTTLRDWTSVRFVDGVITECSVASTAQEGDDVIDAAGGTVLPGLIDAHVHMVPGSLAQSLTFGVTTVLDMFSKPELVARAKEEAGTPPGRGRSPLCRDRCDGARRASVNHVRPVPDRGRR
jgi:predicted amidohydrolase YtcJ